MPTFVYMYLHLLVKLLKIKKLNNKRMPNLAAWWQRQRTAYIPFLKKLQERKEEILPWAGGNSPNLWTNMQANQDLWHEARNIKGEIASIEKAARAYG